MHAMQATRPTHYQVMQYDEAWHDRGCTICPMPVYCIALLCSALPPLRPPCRRRRSAGSRAKHRTGDSPYLPRAHGMTREGQAWQPVWNPLLPL
jgi:hypothetical protein